MAKKRVDWSEFSQHTDPVAANEGPPVLQDIDPGDSMSDDSLEVADAGKLPSSVAHGVGERFAEATGSVTVARSRRRLPPKHPVTYRLPLDVLDLIEFALDQSYERGEKLSKEDAVATAIRRTYGHLGTAAER